MACKSVNGNLRLDKQLGKSGLSLEKRPRI